MKRLLFIVAVSGLIMSSCSSSSRMGYTYFDDMYDDRPFYAQASRSGQGNFQQAPADNRRQAQPQYRDDEFDQQSFRDQDAFGGEYTDRINRFHRRSGSFDYFSPFYTGFNSGFGMGFGMGMGMGLGGFNSPFMNPWNRSRFSFGFGWGSPMMGMGWGSPFIDPFFDPFWGSPMMGWGSPFGLNRPIGWGSPWGGIGWGSPWGWGSPIIINNYYGDRNRRNLYYGPRSGLSGNSYIGRPARGNMTGNSTTLPGQSGLQPSNTIRTNSGIQMQRTERPNLASPGRTEPTAAPSRSGTRGDNPAITTPSRGNDGVRPSPNATPRQQVNPGVAPRQTPNRGAGYSPDQGVTPRYRYSQPSAPSWSAPSEPRRPASPSSPTMSPGRGSSPSMSAPSPRMSSPSPRMSAPSAPARSAPSSAPSRGGGSSMQRTPR